jgi:hypothetical protein
MQWKPITRYEVILVATLLLGTTAFADGIPVTADKKGVRGEYSRVALHRKQIVDVETRRKVILRPDQKAQLEEIAGGPLGDITVYNSRYNMCTCFDNNVMAIWTQKGFLDFPHSWLLTRQQQEERRKEGKGESADESSGDTEYKRLIVVLDSHGEMYVKGKHKSLNVLKAEIDALRKGRLKNRGKTVKWSVVFDPPPPVSEEIDKKVTDKFHEIVKHCKKRGIETQGWGVESEPF